MGFCCLLLDTATYRLGGYRFTKVSHASVLAGPDKLGIWTPIDCIMTWSWDHLPYIPIVSFFLNLFVSTQCCSWYWAWWKWNRVMVSNVLWKSSCFAAIYLQVCKPCAPGSAQPSGAALKCEPCPSLAGSLGLWLASHGIFEGRIFASKILEKNDPIHEPTFTSHSHHIKHFCKIVYYNCLAFSSIVTGHFRRAGCFFWPWPLFFELVHVF